ncbi:MAG: EamA family transporter [Collinsella sp.]
MPTPPCCAAPRAQGAHRHGYRHLRHAAALGRRLYQPESRRDHHAALGLYLCQPHYRGQALCRRVDPLSLGVWQLGFGGLFSGIAACVFGGFALPSTPSEIVVVVALALICSAYGFITQTLVQPHVPAETTGFAFSLEPVCSAVFRSSWSARS